MKTRQTDSWTNGTKVSLVVRQTDEWTDGETIGQTDRYMGRQDRWVDGQLNKQAKGWTDRQARQKTDRDSLTARRMGRSTDRLVNHHNEWCHVIP